MNFEKESAGKHMVHILLWFPLLTGSKLHMALDNARSCWLWNRWFRSDIHIVLRVFAKSNESQVGAMAPFFLANRIVFRGNHYFNKASDF